MSKVDGVVKIKFVGDSGVGKTSIISRYVDGTFFDNQQPTIGVDYKTKIVDISGKRIKVIVWDTAGQEKFRTLTKTYYKSMHGLLMVYDICSEESFDNIEKWLTEFQTNTSDKFTQILLVGNKVDLADKRKVTRERAETWALRNQMQYVETSAKTVIGIEDAFKLLICSICDSNRGIMSEEKEPSHVTLDTSSKTMTSGCC